MVKKETMDAIRGAITEGIRRNGQRIFDISQQTENCYVPVRTGFLKENGGWENIERGVNLYYRTPYAADVEFGSDSKPVSGTQSVHVKSHTRKGYTTKTGKRVQKHNVSAYDMQLKDKKLVSWEPRINKFQYGERIFRVVDKEGGQKGQFFLTRAFYEGFPELVHDINFHLQRLNGTKNSSVVKESPKQGTQQQIADRVENEHQRPLSRDEREFLQSEQKNRRRASSKNRKKRGKK